MFSLEFPRKNRIYLSICLCYNKAERYSQENVSGQKGSQTPVLCGLFFLFKLIKSGKILCADPMRLQPDLCFPASISMCSDISAPFSIPKFRSFLFPYERQIFFHSKKTAAYYLKNRHASCRFIRKKKENKDVTGNK